MLSKQTANNGFLQSLFSIAQNSEICKILDARKGFVPSCRSIMHYVVLILVVSAKLHSIRQNGFVWEDRFLQRDVV